MQERYERVRLVITAFDVEDVLTASAANPEDGIQTVGGDDSAVSF